MPEVFLEFLGDASPWLLLLLIPLYFWGKLNHDALHNRESHPESFERTIGWLRENNLGLLYLKALGWLMDKISDIIGDRQQFNQIYVTAAHPSGFIHKTFGLNPFTPKSYDKCLRLAFLYPVFSFFIAWALGSAGLVGGVDWLSQQKGALVLSSWQRWLLIGSMLLLVFGGLWFVHRWQGWRQWLALNIPFLLAGLVYWVEREQSLATFFAMWTYSWFIFLLFWVFVYSGGWLTSWLVYRSKQQAHADIYQIAFAFAFAFTCVVSTTLSVADVNSDATVGAFIFIFFFFFAVVVAGIVAARVAGDGFTFAVTVAGGIASITPCATFL
jgi:hypothetical protein